MGLVNGIPTVPNRLRDVVIACHTQMDAPYAQTIFEAMDREAVLRHACQESCLLRTLIALAGAEDA